MLYCDVGNFLFLCVFGVNGFMVFINLMIVFMCFIEENGVI